MSQQAVWKALDRKRGAGEQREVPAIVSLSIADLSDQTTTKVDDCNARDCPAIERPPQISIVRSQSAIA